MSLIHSHCSLSLWKDDSLNIFLHMKGKPAPLTTDGSFVHEQISIFKALS